MRRWMLRPVECPGIHSGVYVNGSKGMKICTEHAVEFEAMRQCPMCKSGKAAPVVPRGSSLPPEAVSEMHDAIVALEGIVDQAAAVLADVDVPARDRAALLRVQLSAISQINDVKMTRAKSAVLDRLANRRPTASAAVDPRDAFDDLGTAAAAEISIAGDN